MVLRLSALKYLLAASSYGFDASSGSWRQDTSACVCTSIAIRSLTFNGRSSSRRCSAALFVPVGKGTAFEHQLHQQWRRFPVHGAEHAAIFLHAGEQRRQADGVGVEHRSAAI